MKISCCVVRQINRRFLNKINMLFLLDFGNCKSFMYLDVLECPQVGPQAVFVVTRDEDDMSSAHTSDLEDEDENDGDDAASWTTVDSAEQRGREVCSSKFHLPEAFI